MDWPENRAPATGPYVMITPRADGSAIIGPSAYGGIRPKAAIRMPLANGNPAT